MSKKSFIEEELAKEAKLRTETRKLSLCQLFIQLLHRKRKNITPAHESSLAKIVIDRFANDLSKDLFR